MPSSKYLSLASSRLSSLREYVSQYPEGGQSPQNWRQWAGQLPQKIKRARTNSGTDEISLFPGWAVRRYDNTGSNAGNIREHQPFAVDVYISGYAFARRAPHLATRSQRAFLKLAKTFASLPKLPTDQESLPPHAPLSNSTENLLASVNLPPRPSEISEDYEIEILEQQFRQLNTANQDPDTSESDLQTSAPSPPSLSFSPNIPSATPSTSVSSISSSIYRLHANLESRMHPFWATALTSRTVRICIFASPPNQAGFPEQQYPPLAVSDVQTDATGYFSATLTVSWEDICHHPGTKHIISGNKVEEHDVSIVTEIFPPPPPAQTPSSRPLDLHNSSQYTATATSMLIVPITHSPLRVISDIDDTVKFSNILSGPRSVFRNVFVKELSDITIPGMAEWYTEMWRGGVRFHYVSNGPFELLPVINDFLAISQLPPGSIRLKSYAGRSLFNGLLSAPATRKRANVLDILTSFSTSQFILIGDSGEQDLELYASLAAERPTQIVGVFVRDVNVTGMVKSVDGVEMIAGLINSIDDPTGARVWTEGDLGGFMKGTASAPVLPGGGSYVSEPDTYFTANPSPPLPPPPLARSTSTGSILQRGPSLVSEPEKRRNELQMRVWRARVQIPQHIPLRIFRRPEECLEAKSVLERFSAEAN